MASQAGAGAPSLPRYLRLAKNLRGVYAHAPGENHEPHLRWLLRRLHYRDAGAAPPAPRGLEPLHYPQWLIHAAEEAAEEMRSNGVPLQLAHSILLSLAYAAPMLLTPGAYGLLEEAGLVAHVVKGPSSLDARSARLHMRIAGYSVLDFLEPAAEEAAAHLAARRSLADLLDKRRKMAQEDARRYWRIAGQGEAPRIAYLEHLHAARGTAPRLTGPTERILLAIPVAYIVHEQA